MQAAAFAAAGLPHIYLRYRVPLHALRRALRDARALRMGGLNLTVPLKETVLPLLDALTPEARRIGAVNTIRFEDGGARLVGDNTDGRGFLRALSGRVRLRGATAVLIGAGGSARAVATALRAAGCAGLVIANRRPARAEALAERLAALGGGRPQVVALDALRRDDVLGDAALVVNATPLGLGDAGIGIRYAATPHRS